jgi:hypothetical protein
MKAAPLALLALLLIARGASAQILKTFRVSGELSCDRQTLTTPYKTRHSPTAALHSAATLRPPTPSPSCSAALTAALTHTPA